MYNGTMIKTPTVLVLGAGASNAYGFPLGIDLRNSVCTILGTQLGKGGVVQRISDAGYDLGELKEFGHTLQHSGYTSVDWFLEDFPQFIEVGKASIAICCNRINGRS